MLSYLAANPVSTIRRISDALNISERQVARVLKDLHDDGVVSRAGERGHYSYSLNPRSTFTNPGMTHIPIKPFMDLMRLRLSDEWTGRADYQQGGSGQQSAR